MPAVSQTRLAERVIECHHDSEPSDAIPASRLAGTARVLGGRRGAVARETWLGRQLSGSESIELLRESRGSESETNELPVPDIELECPLRADVCQLDAQGAWAVHAD